MRIAGSYLGAAMVSACIAVLLLALGHVDPGAPRGALEAPRMLVVLSPEFAIQLRRADALLAGAAPEIVVTLRLLATTVAFAVLNAAPLVLFETTDDAWRGVRLWEVPKPIWAALIFASLSSAIYMAAVLLEIAPVPRLALPPAAFAVATLAGGLFFGLGKPRREPIDE